MDLKTDPPLRLISQAMRRGANRLADFSSIWPTVAADMAHGIGQNIASKAAGLEFGPWPQPTAAYARRKAAEGFGRESLVRTGATVAAATNPNSIVGMSRHYVTLGLRGSKWAHTPALNFPGKRGNGRSYQFFGWNTPMQKAVEGRLASYVQRVIDDIVRDAK